MNIQTNNTDCNGIEIVNHDGTLRVSSREVAERFGKRHDHVLRAIRNLIRKSPDWGSVHFLQFKVNDLTGESTSHVEMTRDGFALLVMGFTGKRAMAWKIRFLEAFNAMEAELRTVPQSAALTAFNTGADDSLPRLITYLETLLLDRGMAVSKAEALRSVLRIARAIRSGDTLPAYIAGAAA